jgi:hypothetical protein
MKINGAYKFRTQAITGRLRLFFRYNETVWIGEGVNQRPSFRDQIFIELGVTGSSLEIFKNSYAVESYNETYNAYVISRRIAYHKGLNNKWIVSFVTNAYRSILPDRVRQLATIKENSFLAFFDKQTLLKRYPEPSENDALASWTLDPHEYSLWENSLLTDMSDYFLGHPPLAIKQDQYLRYYGSGVWGSGDRCNRTWSVFPEFHRSVTSAYFTEENEYTINTIKSSVFLPGDPPYSTETYLHPLFDERRSWTLPGFRCFPWLFSEDRKELIYLRVYVDIYVFGVDGVGTMASGEKEIYYIKFSDDGAILEDTLIVDLKYYEDLPTGHPEKLNENDILPEIPFWTVSAHQDTIALNDREDVSFFCRFKSGKVEWVDIKTTVGNIIMTNLTPDEIQSVLSQEFFSVKIAEWNGQKFVEQESKKYKVVPTHQDLIDYYKTSGVFNPQKTVSEFSLSGVGFY